MNYLAIGKDFGGDAERKSDATQNLDDMSIIWDVVNKAVEMPVKDNGTAPRITLTDIRDIGRFVAAACELPEGQWQTSMEMSGDTIDADDVTGILEEVGGEQFRRRTVDRKTLEGRVASVEGIGSSREEMVKKMVSQIELAMLEDTEGKCLLSTTMIEVFVWLTAVVRHDDHAPSCQSLMPCCEAD